MVSTSNHNTELARELGRAMAEMKYLLRQFLQSRIKTGELDITFELLEVMMYLKRKDGANQQEIADVMAKDKSSITYVVDNLVKRGLVMRKEDERDRRNKRIYLTDTGKELIEKINPMINEVYDKATNGIDPAEIERSIALVQQMNDNLRKEE
jgi:DNA-binding MarR family transcriptional regulator